MTKIEEYIDEAVRDIIALCAIPSPTGFTDLGAEFIEKRLREIGASPVRTRKGGVWVEFGPDANPLALTAHFDTLGAMVRAVKGSGRLRYTRIGGYPDLYLVAETCRVHTRDGRSYGGTFQPCNPSVHANNKLSEFKPGDDTMEIVLDELVSKEEEVAALGISPGDFVSIDARSVLTEKGFIKSRHLDDKASCGILLGLARAIKDGVVKPTRKVCMFFTCYEEVGHGASALHAKVNDIVAVDMGVVGDDVKCDERKVSICAKDSNGPYDYALTNALVAAAKKADVPYAIDIYPFYGSDVAAALYAGHDIRFGLIGPGVFASHGYERTHRDAVAASLGLLSELVIA